MKNSMNLSLPMGFTLQGQLLVSLANILKVEDNTGDGETAETANADDRPKVTNVSVPRKEHSFPPTRIQSDDRPKVTRVTVKRKGMGEVPFEYTVTLDFEEDYPEGEYFVKVLMVTNGKYLETPDAISISGASRTFVYPSATAVYGVSSGSYNFEVTISQLGTNGNPVLPETSTLFGDFDAAENVNTRQSLWQKILNFFRGKK